MTALVFWLLYCFLAFVVAPAIFRLRYRRWPYAYPLHAPDGYLIIDLAYAGAMIAFTLSLFSSMSRSSYNPSIALQTTGVLLGVLAVALGAWAIVSLGPSWRFGQDRNATDVTKVTTGPYRIMRHPIYAMLIMLSMAMTLMSGATGATIAFAVVTLCYALVQASSENRRWHRIAA